MLLAILVSLTIILDLLNIIVTQMYNNVILWNNVCKLIVNQINNVLSAVYWLYSYYDS